MTKLHQVMFHFTANKSIVWQVIFPRGQCYLNIGQPLLSRHTYTKLKVKNVCVLALPGLKLIKQPYIKQYSNWIQNSYFFFLLAHLFKVMVCKVEHWKTKRSHIFTKLCLAVTDMLLSKMMLAVMRLFKTCSVGGERRISTHLSLCTKSTLISFRSMRPSSEHTRFNNERQAKNQANPTQYAEHLCTISW